MPRNLKIYVTFALLCIGLWFVAYTMWWVLALGLFLLILMPFILKALWPSLNDSLLRLLRQGVFSMAAVWGIVAVALMEQWPLALAMSSGILFFGYIREQ